MRFLTFFNVFPGNGPFPGNGRFYGFWGQIRVLGVIPGLLGVPLGSGHPDLPDLATRTCQDLARTWPDLARPGQDLPDLTPNPQI